MTKFLTTSVFIGLFALCSFSQDQPCDENTLLAVPDVFVIEEADILSFQANVLDNDIINVDDFYVNPHGVPPCFVLSEEGIISISPDADPTFILEECCGTHFFWYTLISEGYQCQRSEAMPSNKTDWNEQQNELRRKTKKRLGYATLLDV